MRTSRLERSEDTIGRLQHELALRDDLLEVLQAKLSER